MALKKWYYIVPILILAGCSSNASKPLWPGSKFTESDRTNAMLRALAYIQKSADDSKNLASQADYLYCFYSIADTARDPQLRAAAARIAPKYAKMWAKNHATVSANAGPNTVAGLIFGWLPAALLGEDDSRIKPDLQRASDRYKAVDFIGFDPAREPPPSDIPEPCEFDSTRNPRGSTVCTKCGRPLHMQNKYAVWLDALIDSFSGDRYGVRMGASFRDVIKWMPAMRPYPDPRTVSQGEFLDVLYALTHVVYTLNDYGHYLIPRDLLPEEFAYLRANLPQAIALHDPETMGEFLDALKGFGLDESDPVIQTGVTYLLENQRADGTWGPANETDYYVLYHAAWTAIDGLKDCRWQGERLSFPELQPLLENMRHAPPPVVKIKP
jgi:hypothetical protein